MSEAGAGRVVVCRVGDERFALPLAVVRQVVAAPPVTRLPGAPEAVRGVANVQGTLVTVVNGPLLLGRPVAVRSEWLVVLTMHDGRVGLEVDEVEDVQEQGLERLRTLGVEEMIRPFLEAAGPG